MEKNLQNFLYFRLAFIARFYYPIYAALFLDFGISLGEFSILNGIWALTIILFEVPSGALADIFGRKKLVVFASVLMCLEMIIFIFAPIGSGTTTLLFLLVNRVVSGLEEAMASGADEALAYDSIVGDNPNEIWAKFYGKVMRYLSFAFIVTMLLGAFLYDSNAMNYFFNKILGLDVKLSKEFCMKLPLIFNFFSALGALYFSLRMVEVNFTKSSKSVVENCKSGLVNLVDAGKWLFNSKILFRIILFGMLFDSAVRLFYTNASQFYRIIEYKDVFFGPIAMSIAVIALFTSMFADKILLKFSYYKVILMSFCFTLVALWGISLAIPYWGILFVFLFPVTMRLQNQFQSFYINRDTRSGIRATVLSFRSLADNISFGFVSLLFAIQANYIASGLRKVGKLAEDEVKILTLKDSMPLWPIVFIFAVIICLLGIKIKERRNKLSSSI